MGPNSPPVCAYEVGVFGGIWVCKMWHQNQLILYNICSSGSSTGFRNSQLGHKYNRDVLDEALFPVLWIFLYFIYTS